MLWLIRICITIIIAHGKEHGNFYTISDIQHVGLQSVMLRQSNIIYLIMTVFKALCNIKLL